jgi:hypothetical protein
MHTTQSRTPGVSTSDDAKRMRRSLFSSLSEGIRMSRARSRVESLLSDAFLHCGSVDTLKDAAAAFLALDPKRKEDVLSFIEKRLRRCSHSTFDSEMKVQSAIVISQFLSEMASRLPVDGRGNKQNSEFERFMPSLVRISQGDPFFRGSCGEHVQARVSCTRALWDMEFSEIEFWEERMKDPVTSSLTIKLLLEMPLTENPDAHGWALLREHLSDSAYDIARNESPERIGFLMSILKTGEPDKAEAVFNALLRLDVDFIPRELAARGVEMRLDPTDPALRDCASRFWDLLQKKVNQKIKADTNPSGTISPEAPETSSVQGERAAPKNKAPKRSDLEIEMQHYVTMLNCADDRQFESANELISRYMMGRSMLGPLLPSIAQEMLDIIKEPAGQEKEERAAQQKKAFAVLCRMFDDGMARRTAIKKLLDMSQEDELPSWRLLENVFPSISFDIAGSDSSNKARFLLHMLQDPDDEVVRAALHASVYLDRIPNRMFAMAYGMTQRQGVADDAAVFMEVSLQKEELESKDVSRHKAALTILDLHLRGNKHLARMIERIAEESYPGAPSSSDIGQTLVLAHLNAVGIRPGGVDLFGPDSLASTIHSLLEMPEADGFRYRAWHLMAANIDALAIPIAESASSKRIEFIMSMVHANNPASIGTALQVSAYLDHVPAGLLALAQDILEHEEAQILWRPAKALIVVERLKSVFSSGGSKPDFASGLVSLFNEGNQHLGLMLRRLGSELESIPKGGDPVEAERARTVLDEIRKTLTG